MQCKNNVSLEFESALNLFLSNNSSNYSAKTTAKLYLFSSWWCGKMMTRLNISCYVSTRVPLPCHDIQYSYSPSPFGSILHPSSSAVLLKDFLTVSLFSHTHVCGHTKNAHTYTKNKITNKNVYLHSLMLTIISTLSPSLSSTTKKFFNRILPFHQRILNKLYMK